MIAAMYVLVETPVIQPIVIKTVLTNAVTVQIDGSTGWTVTPAENWFGTKEVYIAGYDGYFYTYDTLQVTVAPVNDAPDVAAIPDVAFNEDGSYVLSLDSYTDDVDNDSTEHGFTATVLDDTTGNLILSIDDSTHYLTFSSPTDSTGSFTVMVGVLDDSLASDSDTFMVTINQINDAPVLVNSVPDTVIYRNTGVYVLVPDLDNVFRDIENDLLQYTVSVDGDGVTPTVQNKVLSVVLVDDNGSTEEIIVTAADDEFTTTDTFNISFVQYKIR